MNWRNAIPPAPVSVALSFAVACIGGAVLLGSCGDDDDGSGDISGSTWTTTVDPYGREWACLNVTTVDGEGGGLFCVPAPETP